MDSQPLTSMVSYTAIKSIIAIDLISPKMTGKEFSIFIILSDTYTCSYVV